jgi:glutamate dehydrogenase (NAD(P)+)
VLVAASDTSGTIVDENGLDLAALIALKAEGRALHDYGRGRKLGMHAVIDIPCDIWILAARPDVIDADNVARLRTRILAEGAYIPCSAGAEQALAARGVLVLPDFIANAGGVICAAIEYGGGTEAAALAYIEEKIRANTEAVLDEVQRTGALPRTVALALATERAHQAMRTRRWDTGAR